MLGGKSISPYFSMCPVETFCSCVCGECFLDWELWGKTPTTDQNFIKIKNNYNRLITRSNQKTKEKNESLQKLT